MSRGMSKLRSIVSGRAEIAAEIVGTGTPIVFLHAGVADRRMWRDQVDALARSADQFLTITYDRRGFGDTLHAEEAYSHVGDLLAVLDAVAADHPAVLVGCSQGGRIAIDFALAHPQRVKGLLLVAPGITGAPEVTSFPPAVTAWMETMERAEAEADVDRVNALEAHAWLDGPMAKEGRVRGTARELFLAMNEIALRSEQRGTQLQPPSAYTRLPEIGAPALVLCGDLDFGYLVAQCEYLVQQLPRAKHDVMTGTAHLPNLEDPARFNRILLEFCASV